LAMSGWYRITLAAYRQCNICGNVACHIGHIDIWTVPRRASATFGRCRVASIGHVWTVPDHIVTICHSTPITLHLVVRFSRSKNWQLPHFISYVHAISPTMLDQHEFRYIPSARQSPTINCLMSIIYYKCQLSSGLNTCTCICIVGRVIENKYPVAIIIAHTSHLQLPALVID